jgi:hypothetical protein
VTGQRSNQLSYTPAKTGTRRLKKDRGNVKFCFGILTLALFRKSGQQTPRRWGWGTPLKKRAATRMSQM